MKTHSSIPTSFIRLPLLLLALVALLASAAQAQVPTMISYQGRVLMNDTNFTGVGYFKFALMKGTGPSVLWRNGGGVISVADSEPATAVELPVVNGLFMVVLGDTTLPNMPALPAHVFTHEDVRLRIWFDGGEGFQQLAPDQRIVSVGYAMMAGNVPDGVITAAKLANGAITAAKLADNAITAGHISDGSVSGADLAPDSVNTSHIVDGQVTANDLGENVVTSDKIADGSVQGVDLAEGSVGTPQLKNFVALGASDVDGRLQVYSGSAGAPAITLFGGGSRISTYGSDGLEQARLWGSSYGELLLHNDLANNAKAVRLSAEGSLGGLLELKNSDGDNRAALAGRNTGGKLSLYQTDGSAGAFLYGEESGTGAGALSLRKADGNTGMRAFGGTLSGSLQLLNRFNEVSLNLWNYDNEEGVVSVRNSRGGETVYLWGRDSYGDGHGQIGLKQHGGIETVTLQASEGGNGSQMLMRKSNGTLSIQLDAEVGSSGGGYLDLRDANGNIAIVANGDTGTTTTRVLEITGGADLSENFNINASSPEPGMIVSIDPRNPGELIPSTEDYDKKVAGIISGAGGVSTGMLMGQRGSVADGDHPVALTGRVYCWVDSDAGGAIEPGDLITTSATPGHGMKATDHARAQGAVIGKAMTALDSGKGLVLVLVTLQ